MIYTVTFNPALDYAMYLDAFTDGGTNRARKEELTCGGKGINVSFVLHTLGVEAMALGFLAGHTGKMLRSYLSECGIPSDFITLPAGMTRINVKLKCGGETEINGRGPDIDPGSLAALEEKLHELHEGDTLVLAGSIPASLPADIYEKILAGLSGRGIRFVVDATGKLLENVLCYRPFLMKPNHTELGELFGVTLAPEDEAGIIRCARTLQAKGGRNVLVSMAQAGALLLTETGEILRQPPARGTLLNSVGAGDSMVAGFLAGWQQTGDYEYALRLGTAAGGATAFSPGLATRAEIDAVLKTLSCFDRGKPRHL